MLIHKLLQIPNNTPEMEHAFKLFVEHYADDLIGQSRFFPHALETLAYYSDKKKAILTNKPQQLTVAILKALKIDSHFMAVVGADDRFGRKPETAGILHIIRKAGTIPEKTIMIGDGDTDILVGKRAGTFTCALANGFRSRELLEMLDPDFLLEDLSQLRNIL
jgi:HAD superfamily hydrolase (TIGR01549 family)